MIGMIIVENTLARNNPGAFSDAIKADISDMMYMEAMRAMPMTALILFTFFNFIHFALLSIDYNNYIEFWDKKQGK
jgi:hypothetical protein